MTSGVYDFPAVSLRELNTAPLSGFINPEPVNHYEDLSTVARAHDGGQVRADLDRFSQIFELSAK